MSRATGRKGGREAAGSMTGNVERGYGSGLHIRSALGWPCGRRRPVLTGTLGRVQVVTERELFRVVSLGNSVSESPSVSGVSVIRRVSVAGARLSLWVSWRPAAKPFHHGKALRYAGLEVRLPEFCRPRSVKALAASCGLAAADHVSVAGLCCPVSGRPCPILCQEGWSR